MKHLLRAFLLLICLKTQIAFAGNYKESIATDRLILVFKNNITAEEKNRLIESSGMIKTYTHLPSPKITVCFTDKFSEASELFSRMPEIAFVSFFIGDGNEHYAGVLNNFFVKLSDKNFEPFLRNELKRIGVESLISDKYVDGLYKSKLPDNYSIGTIEICDLLQQLPYVKYAAPNYLFNPLVTSSDPLYNRQWNISNTGSGIQGSGVVDADMDVDEAWDITTGSSSIKISIVDSGVDTLQPDLIQNILPGHDAVGDSTDGFPTPLYKEDGHGTCCAGIAAAVKDNNIGIAGVAPSCKILPVRAFYYLLLQGASGPIPYSTSDAFSDAIGWSWSVGGADILSNSWGLPPTLLMVLPGGPLPVEDAIATAYQNGRNGKGCVMFFSSGNENGSTGPLWPGSLPQTIAVNATNMCDKRKSPGDCSGENWGGDHGGNLDFSAPGVKIATTDMRGSLGFAGGDYYYAFNGTSAACPNAAAVGALVLSVRSDLDAEGVRNVIALTCDKVGGYGYDSTRFAGSWCNEMGYGRVNAYRAVELAPQFSSIGAVESNTILQVFPNPATGVLNIKLEAASAPAFVFDHTGGIVQSTILEMGVNTIDVSKLSSGMYYLHVQNGQTIVRSKFTLMGR